MRILQTLLAVLLFSSCGPKISDRRVEKFTFPSGEVLINESQVEQEGPSCLLDCGPDRQSKLTIQFTDGTVPEEVYKSPRHGFGNCCLMEQMKPIRLERSSDIQAIVFGRFLFTKWPAGPGDNRKWNQERLDNETGYFLRNSSCELGPALVQGLPPCRTYQDYDQVSVALNPPVARFSRSIPVVGWPATLVYSAPTRSAWQFDLEQTTRANPDFRYHAFPSHLRVEARFLQVEGQHGNAYNSPGEFERYVPRARVTLLQTFPISTNSWTTVSTALGSGRYSYEFRAAYGDPNPEWVTVYTRFTGSEGHRAHFLPIGEWIAFDTEVSTKANATAVGYIRVVRQ